MDHEENNKEAYLSRDFAQFVAWSNGKSEKGIVCREGRKYVDGKKRKRRMLSIRSSM